MNVLEENSGSIFSDHQKTETVCHEWKLGTRQSDYTVP